MKNIAFIDGQNLYRGTRSSREPWEINFERFRIFLKYKYKVKEAYYFIGYRNDKNKKLYKNLQKVGFILIFKKHKKQMSGNKKGNVDTDIVFNILTRVYERDNFDQIILVSGDGDYIALVEHLIKKNKFNKILFPNKEFASSLYKSLRNKYFDFLEDKYIKDKIKKEGP